MAMPFFTFDPVMIDPWLLGRRRHLGGVAKLRLSSAGFEEGGQLPEMLFSHFSRAIHHYRCQSIIQIVHDRLS